MTVQDKSNSSCPAVSYGPHLFQGFAGRSQEVTFRSGEQADHMLPQTGAEDHASGILGDQFYSSSLIFLSKREKMSMSP